MATLPQGTVVVLDEDVCDALRFPPPSRTLLVAVHDLALRASWDQHTQVLHVTDGAVDWVGALGEDLVSVLDEPPVDDVRLACARLLFRGPRMWEVVRPGALVKPGVPRPLSTVYDGSDLRPWVVLGETATGDLIAAPLNDPRRNPKWWTPIIARDEMDFPGNNMDAQVELAHLWTLPQARRREGYIWPAGRTAVTQTIESYFG